MKRTLAMVTAVMMASAAPALAGDAMKKNAVDAQLGTSTETQVEAGANAGTSTDLDAGADVELDAGTTASTSGSASFDSVISAIEADATSTAELETMTDMSNVEIVRIGELEGNDPAALDAALEENNAQVTDLRSAIKANSALTAKLELESVDVSSVVATEMETDGSLTVYVR